LLVAGCKLQVGESIGVAGVCEFWFSVWVVVCSVVLIGFVCLCVCVLFSGDTNFTNFHESGRQRNRGPLYIRKVRKKICREKPRMDTNWHGSSLILTKGNEENKVRVTESPAFAASGHECEELNGWNRSMVW
jgi:hypothetical protein